MNKDQVYNIPFSPTALEGEGSSPNIDCDNDFNYKINGEIIIGGGISSTPVDAGIVIETGFKQGVTVKIDRDGNVTFAGGAIKALTEKYNFADFDHSDVDTCIVGYMLIENDTGSQFVGGTTNLDTSDLTVTFFESYGVIGM